MDEKRREAIALKKFQLIAPVLNQDFPDTSQTAYFSRIGNEKREKPDGTYGFISPNTLRDWVYLYRKYGFDGLKPTQRNQGKSDFGKKLTPEQKRRILELKQENLRRTVRSIYNQLIYTGEIEPNTVSLTTVQRFVSQERVRQKWLPQQERRAFEMAHGNDCWQIDTSYGPYIYDENGRNPQRLYIIAAIDDASRLIVGAELFLHDTAINVQSVLKRAMKRYGLPKCVYTDNGSPYKNKQLELILAQLSIQLRHARIRSGASKAKIERTFRTLKDGWMPQIDYKNFSTIEEFNDSLTTFINEKNRKIHRTLGISPWQRFLQDEAYISRKVPLVIDQAFLHTGEYRVDATGIIKVKKVELELGYAYCGQRVTIKYEPDGSHYYLHENDDLTEIFPVDKVANSRIPRKQISLAPREETSHE